MENEILNFLTSYGFKIPSFIIVVLAIIKLRPITFFTATKFERKLFSKEADTVFTLYYFFLGCIFFTFLLLFLTIINTSIPFNLNIGLLLIYLSAIFHVCLTETTFIRPFIEKKINHRIKHFLRKHIDIIPVGYITFLMYSFVYFLGNFSINNIKDTSSNLSNFEIISKNFITISIVYFFYSLILLFMIRKVMQTKPFKLAEKYFYYIDDNKFEWYLLRPLNKDQYLIGDQFDINSCTKIKLVNKDELFKNEFLIKK